MPRYKVILLIVPLIFNAFLLQAVREKEEWKLVKEDKVCGIKVYYRTLSTGYALTLVGEFEFETDADYPVF